MASERTEGATAGGPKVTAPRSPRGERTRTSLVEAARRVFERDGYLDARLVDITEEAEVSSGTFYTYFESKEQIFAAVLESVQEDMLHLHVRERIGDDDVGALIEAANREYLRSYQENARLMALLEQVAQIDQPFQEMRRRRADAFITRNAKLIGRLQDEGRVDGSLDAAVTATALSAMVSRTAYQVFVLGERIPFETLVTTLNRLWTNALRLDEPPPEGVQAAADRSG